MSSALDNVHTKHPEDKVLSLWLIIIWFKFFRNCYSFALNSFPAFTQNGLRNKKWVSERYVGGNVLLGKKKFRRKKAKLVWTARKDFWAWTKHRTLSPLKLLAVTFLSWRSVITLKIWLTNIRRIMSNEIAFKMCVCVCVVLSKGKFCGWKRLAERRGQGENGETV